MDGQDASAEDHRRAHGGHSERDVDCKTIEGPQHLAGMTQATDKQGVALRGKCHRRWDALVQLAADETSDMEFRDGAAQDGFEVFKEESLEEIVSDHGHEPEDEYRGALMFVDVIS